MVFKHDVLIVGSGLAGLRAATEVAGKMDVALFSKVYPTRSHSGAAQGGIAAALGNEEPDSVEWHTYDTVKGGDYCPIRTSPRSLRPMPSGRYMNWNTWGFPLTARLKGKSPSAISGAIPGFRKGFCKAHMLRGRQIRRVIMDTLYFEAVKRGIRIYPEFHVMDLIIRDGQVAGWLHTNWPR